MSTPISDIDFISKYNPDLAEAYKTAKSLYIDAPIQTLVQLRSLLEVICGELINEYQLTSKGSDLNEIVEYLRNSRLFRSEIIEYMHSIRKAGNEGAHVKELNISFTDLSNLALKSLIDFCKLAEALWQHKDSKTPIYQFSEVINSPLKEWCYEAIFNNDVDAKFNVGAALLDKYRDQCKDEKSFLIDQTPLLKAVDFIQEAAQGLHPEAMLEYGVVLIDGSLRELAFEEGKQYVYRSASQGFWKAQVEFARLVVSSDIPDDYDIENAFSFAMEAAEHGHGQAQYLLSKLHSMPQFKSENKTEAAFWHNKAVESGDRDALFEHASGQLNKSLSNEDAVKAMRQLISAVEKGHQDAYKLYISIYKNTSHPTDVIRKLFDDYLSRYPDDYQMRAEFAEWLYDKGSNNLELRKESLLKLIALFREKDLPSKLRSQLSELSPKWLNEYEKDLQNLGIKPSDKHIALLLQFKVDGTPHTDILEIGEKMTLMHQNLENLPKLIYKSIFTTQSKPATVNQGRNELCKCGSGKKFKRCCVSTVRR